MKRSHAVIVGITLVSAGFLASQSPVAESAAKYFHETKTVTVPMSNIATCPSGFKVTGGGYADVPQTYNFQTDRAFESVQVLSSAPKGNNAWEVKGVHTQSRKGSDGTWLTKGYPLPLTVFAVCTR